MKKTYIIPLVEFEVIEDLCSIGMNNYSYNSETGNAASDQKDINPTGPGIENAPGTEKDAPSSWDW